MNQWTNASTNPLRLQSIHLKTNRKHSPKLDLSAMARAIVHWTLAVRFKPIRYMRIMASVMARITPHHPIRRFLIHYASQPSSSLPGRAHREHVNNGWRHTWHTGIDALCAFRVMALGVCGIIFAWHLGHTMTLRLTALLIQNPGTKRSENFSTDRTSSL